MTLALMFVLASQYHNLPEGLLSAVCYVESHHNPKAMHHDDGGADSVGVCQIQPPTARLLGYKGPKAHLRDWPLNIMLAGQYLRRQIDRYDGDVPKAVSAYNMGSWKANRQGRTVNQKYVDKVMKAWKDRK